MLQAQIAGIETAGLDGDESLADELLVLLEGAQRGMRVAITFHGFRDVGRPQPMKVFQGAFTDEDAAEFVDDENDAESVERAPARKRAPAKKAKGRK